MSFNSIYDISGSAMRAQVMRLDTIASNLANADTAASTEEGAYKALKPVFSAMYKDSFDQQNVAAAVNTMGVTESNRTVEQRYEPNNPLANDDGYVFYSNVNVLEEMADMMSASRSYQTSVDVMSRVNSMQQSILKLGQ
ncbi:MULTISPECIES: flagellar basal body rod protein FlgC [Pseudoalteromonas]|jgi:flagellar basal-body rod protein FlgC|uniref:flagellar basal body rod protein FlgC n=1 Tax=Pseudoalteromonas TaxID=53246 RepID=UPI000781F7D9|nr:MULTISPECIES: flagellar basal body rod protein FlgC [Gammaproteobacteria]MCF7500722.1 flagellar basal body rod protein FlgC [Pseudoalteromonas sp. L1]RZF92248.1 flagellar basal body rod protein FlgC [Pseudoalteromonas sp. CO302Y]RZG08483.1 flagellar basal body rod protein FlgC [Pseudoalteromonas sp. CO133X]UJX26343.1 flagellar basal body rod protein FlgC [Pseudoalteromonas sp. CF6-2]WOC27137.1 flagellar basal body rod protein FlgC [Pseudoalteromonas sp. N1230-9]|tara:strand:+ start:1025 stop:1441 length:417 start_codon:yes stop_codon:yes gene_type:complete